MTKVKIVLTRPRTAEYGCMLCPETDQDKVYEIVSTYGGYFIVLCAVCCRTIYRKLSVGQSDEKEPIESDKF